MNKLSLLVIIFATIILPCTFGAAEVETVEALEKRLLDKHKPSKVRCGAAAHEGIDPSNPSATRVKDNVEGRLTCMITGFKDVFWGSPTEIKRSPELNQLLEKYKINTFILETPQGHKELILYTAKGKKYAELLIKLMIESELTPNRYLRGHLLGYDDKDIEYFYRDPVLFKADKQAAEEWLKKNLAE
jgi:hypothetical protein